nr:MAG TPA: hypothetical protein [Caudoviricetes sp.]
MLWWLSVHKYSKPTWDLSLAVWRVCTVQESNLQNCYDQNLI